MQAKSRSRFPPPRLHELSWSWYDQSFTTGRVPHSIPRHADLPTPQLAYASVLTKLALYSMPCLGSDGRPNMYPEDSNVVPSCESRYADRKIKCLHPLRPQSAPADYRNSGSTYPSSPTDRRTLHATRIPHAEQISCQVYQYNSMLPASCSTHPPNPQHTNYRPG